MDLHGDWRMSEAKDQIVKLIVEGDLSSIELIAGRVGLTFEETLGIIQELLSEGKLRGKITEDEKRFFRENVEVSSKPVVQHEEDTPPFMEFNPRPGQLTAIIGLVLLVIGLVGYFLTPPTDVYVANVFSGVLLIGIVIMSGGCYYLGTRKTP